MVLYAPLTKKATAPACFGPSLLIVTRVRGDENDGNPVVGVGEETL
jgi:hypothetical protein